MTLLIIVFIIVRVLMSKRVKMRYFLMIWQVIILRLIIPVSIESEFSPLQFIKPALFKVRESNRETYAMFSNQHNEKVQVENMNEEKAFENVQVTEVEESIDIEDFFRKHALEIWLSGSMICLLIFTFIYWRSKKVFDDAILMNKESPAVRWMQERDKRVKIYTSDRLASPITVGIFHPKIILPKHIQCSNEELLHILTHEYIHIEEKHILWKRLALLAVCVNWFNPIVWLVQRLFCKDTELACDELVVEEIGDDKRESYAISLIQFAEKASSFKEVQSAFSKNDIEERIISIMDHKRKSKFLAYFVMSMCFASITLSATTVTNRSTSYENKENKEFSIQEEAIGQIEVAQDKKYDVNKKGKASKDKWKNEYKQYGLTYDLKTKSFYYKGKKVVYFLDIVNEDKGIYRLEIDEGEGCKVMAIRNAKGDLVGLKEIEVNMDEPFAYIEENGLLSKAYIKESESQSESKMMVSQAEEENENSGSMLDSRTEDKVKEYETYGMTYDSKNRTYYYKGKIVRFFRDRGNHFFFSRPEGDYYLIALRDEKGKLTGFKELTKKEVKQLLDTDEFRGLILTGIND